MKSLIWASVVATVVLAGAPRARATEAKDVPYGTVRLADNITTVVVKGKSGSFVCRPQSGVIKLPVGAYRVYSWTIARTDEAGAKWEVTGMVRPGEAGSLTVTPDKEVSLPFGKPIHSIVHVNKSGSIYSFDHKLEGRQGERVVLTRSGSKPPPPKLRIRSRDGAYDRSLSFAYG